MLINPMDEKIVFTKVVLKDIDAEIQMFEDASENLSASVELKRKESDANNEYRTDIPKYKTKQLKAIDNQIEKSKALKKDVLARIEKIDRAIEKVKKLKSSQLGQYGITFMSKYLKEQKDFFERRINNINRDVETYRRDKNTVEHLEDSDLNNTLRNLITLDKNSISDYKESINRNKSNIAELKQLKKLVRDNTLALK